MIGAPKRITARPGAGIDRERGLRPLRYRQSDPRRHEALLRRSRRSIPQWQIAWRKEVSPTFLRTRSTSANSITPARHTTASTIQSFRKDLFDQVGAVLALAASGIHIQKRLHIPKAFAPRLLRCAGCGCAITAEIQKGHTYYRCTKKNKAVPCAQPLRPRRSSRRSEISRLLSPYWPLRCPGGCHAWLLDLEEKQVSEDCAASLSRKKRRRAKNIQVKIGRLLEMRIDGEIDAKSYADRKAKLMSQKRTLDEDVIEINSGRKPWLEPLRDWILTAKDLPTAVETGSCAEKKGLAQKVFGSNLFLDRQKGRGEAVKPWGLFLDNELSHDVARLLGAARTHFQGQAHSDHEPPNLRS